MKRGKGSLKKEERVISTNEKPVPGGSIQSQIKGRRREERDRGGNNHSKRRKTALRE